MKLTILPIITISTLILFEANAQRNTAFAVTGGSKGTYDWNVLREIDLTTGEVIRTLYDPSTSKTINFKAAPGANVPTNFNSGHSPKPVVAAAAYDALHNRLYYTHMRDNALLYLDLSSKELNGIVNNHPSFNTGNKNDEANVITRMAFAADGTGYALTNDAKSFIRFTTDQKPTITNLGELIDGSKNGTMSVHSQCSSWGGDMVADTYGNLYLITYRNHLFKINPATKITDYLGALKGVPAQFTSNGAVVNNEGELIVSSATTADNYYSVNISTLEATSISKKEAKVYNSSDLANGNLLYQRKGREKFIFNEVKGNQAVSLYPNPVVNKTFTVRFDKVPKGNYTIVLTDASGRTILSRALTIAVTGQVEKIFVPRAAGGGMFLVKLSGGDSRVVYNDRLVVQ